MLNHVQKMISSVLDLTLQEIDLVSSESKSKKSESIKTFQACKYCDQVFPYQIFQMSNVGVPVDASEPESVRHARKNSAAKT